MGEPPSSSPSDHVCATEVLSTEQFNTLFEAQVLIGDWKHEYNNYRPHSSLGWRSPRTLWPASRRTNWTSHKGGPTTGVRPGRLDSFLAPKWQRRGGGDDYKEGDHDGEPNGEPEVGNGVRDWRLTS